jgi:hypothetical protein
MIPSPSTPFEKGQGCEGLLTHLVSVGSCHRRGGIRMRQAFGRLSLLLFLLVTDRAD